MTARPISPMLATLGEPSKRFADFAVEAKYDGQRGLGVLDNGVVTLLSRNGADITRTFSEIAAALAQACDRGVVLDGEIVALDEAGVPSFSRLQRRWAQNRRPPSADLLRQVPVRFYVFDVLSLDGRDITRQPYATRRAHLTAIAANSTRRSVQFPSIWTDTDPRVVLAASAEVGLGGHRVQAPRLPIHPGIPVQKLDQDAPPVEERVRHRRLATRMGPNSRTVGALVVGAHADSRLVFCGLVGAGLRQAERRRLTTALEALHCDASPFANVPSDVARYARWVYPGLAGDIEYREFAATLRHPSWKGLRPDVDCELVTLPRDA